MELPKTFGEFASRVRTALNGLEQQVEWASTPARRQAARLIRDASVQLGRLEVRGKSGWRRLAAPYRRDALRLLRNLERAVAPRRRQAQRKTTTRRRTSRYPRSCDRHSVPPTSSKR